MLLVKGVYSHPGGSLSADFAYVIMTRIMARGRDDFAGRRFPGRFRISNRPSAINCESRAAQGTGKPATEACDQADTYGGSMVAEARIRRRGWGGARLSSVIGLVCEIVHVDA
ncbi:hypothetical protein BI364_06675 [Acidihalobacter yilgarnensis]|uniref:Uncharacterized protein n=1 Tax=Acidihalobacter yilgarnensis TaxID=2819280 RepID=A0A1D8IMI3_9GAMM|nr:hypothetical protein BI364_06675 [Acidihalobacter yilgarnensis]